MPKLGTRLYITLLIGAEFVGLDAIQGYGHLLETQTSSFANGVGWDYFKDKMRKGF